MHPDIAYQPAGQRHAELVAEAAHQRLVHDAKQAHAGVAGRGGVPRRWRRVLLPTRVVAAE
ncbi:MAG TPA: hypothetical protein VFI46_15165 [Jiangellaceae bacterium]|nr:hypothetical protein [Jiangellaceae bacterium]